jgi:hypothetical protein
LAFSNLHAFGQWVSGVRRQDCYNDEKGGPVCPHFSVHRAFQNIAGSEADPAYPAVSELMIFSLKPDT